jgi:hypothetical protein
MADDHGWSGTRLCPEFTTQERAIAGLEDKRALKGAGRFGFAMSYGHIEFFWLRYYVRVGELIDKVIG